MQRIGQAYLTQPANRLVGWLQLPVLHLAVKLFKKLVLDSCLSPCTSINSMWIMDLNIRPDTQVSTGKSGE
jgi:hypothetical protein